MVVIALERPVVAPRADSPSRPATPPRPTPLLKASPRGGPTLEDVLSGAWEDLIAHRTATCPICGGAMAPRYGSGPSAVGGRCGECRTELD